VFAASGAVVGALVVGLVASTWLFIKARTAEQDQARLRQQAETNETKAKNEAVKSQQVSQLFKDMLTGVGPIAAAGRDTGMLREIVDNAAARIGNGLKDQPAIEAEMLTSIGLIYLELDEAERAEAVLRRVLTVRRKLPADEHPMARSGATPSYYGALHTSWMGDERPNVAASLYNLGMALFSQGKVAEAKPMFEEALATNRQLTGDESPEVAACLDVLSVLMSEEGKSDEAENIARGVLAIRKKRLGDEHPDIASSLVVIGRILERKDDLPQAEKMYREALAIWKNEFGAEHRAQLDTAPD
jgi:tetratricopeptide (TPR) repeat protein